MRRILLSLCVLSVSAWSQTITVTSPAAGAVWRQGETRTIQWTRQGDTGASVRVVLRIPGQNEAALVIAGSAPNTGSFSWTIPDSVAPGPYFIRVRSDIPVTGESGGFQIQEKSGTPLSPVAPMRQPGQRMPSAMAQIKVTVPTEGLHFTIGQEFIVAWETIAPGPYRIDLMGEDGKTLIMPLAETPGHSVGTNKYVQGNIHPEHNTQVTLATGWYKIRVRGNAYGSGLSPRFHITGPQVEVLEQLQGNYRDRHSRRRINEENDVQPSLTSSPSLPGRARLGGDFRYDQRFNKWVGFIFRSQVVFPVEQIDMTGKTLKDAWIYIEETKENDGWIGDSPGKAIYYPIPTARGWKVYGLTGPWSGDCIETPGYQVGEIPSHVDSHTIHITDLVRGWLDGTKPNHGLIIGSRFEPFPEWTCFLAHSWYKVTLNLKFLKDK